MPNSQPRYTRDQYQQALEQEFGDISALPTLLRWSAGATRRRQLEREWPSMSLEDRISAAALYFGRYIRGSVENASHVITFGYEMLCRSGTLVADAAP